MAYESLFFWTNPATRFHGSHLSSFQLARDPIINGLAIREGHDWGSDLGSDSMRKPFGFLTGAFYVGNGWELGVAGMIIDSYCEFLWIIPENSLRLAPVRFC